MNARTKKWWKALGVSLLGFKHGVTFNNKRGIVFFVRIGGFWAWLASWSYDVRHKRNGDIYFRLRDMKRERKVEKKIKKILAQ